MSNNSKYHYNLRSAFIWIIIVEVIFWTIVWLAYRYTMLNVPEFRFEHENAKYFLLFIPVIMLFYFYYRSWKNHAIKTYADSKLIPFLFRGFSTSKSVLKYLLLRLGLSFIVIAMANPQYGENEKTVQSKGIDIMIGLDISKSMLAEDLAPGYSRLKIAKLAIEKLIDKLHGDHIGIVVFAGDAYKQLPITPDYHVAKMILANINTDMISSQGTDIGFAIEQCISSFDENSPSNKAIVIFSDGEDHEQKAIESAKEAFDKGIIVSTIGMGTTKGVPIPVYKNGKKVGVKKDQNENTVLTKLNENTLIEIANSGGGSYTRSNGVNVGLEGLIDQINSIEKTTLGEDQYTTYDDKFQIYLLIGLILIIAHTFIHERKSKLEQKLNLFDE